MKRGKPNLSGRAGLALATFIVLSVVTGREWLAGILAVCIFLISGWQEYLAANPGRTITGKESDHE
jgi:hypothetical protein